jgi:hypothetical protein
MKQAEMQRNVTPKRRLISNRLRCVILEDKVLNNQHGAHYEILI